MSEAAQTGPAVTVPPNAISTSQAAQMLAERRAQPAQGASTKPANANANGQGNQVSEAARMLGQHAAKARQERLAQASAQSQGSPQGEGGDVEDDPARANSGGETLNETAENASPGDENPEGQSEPEGEEPQTIDLGDGVSLTLDEVRDGIMMKADHTRKTQEIAKERSRIKERETVQTQKLAQLDKIVSTLEQKLGRPKSLKELIATHGHDLALEKLAEQTEEFERLDVARRVSDKQQREYMSAKLSERDQALAESYNPEWSDAEKRDARYTALTDFALKRGADPEELKFLPSPWMIQVLDMAEKWQALEANKGKVTRHVAERPKVIRPGARVSAQASAASAVTNAHAKLKQSGQLADAVALLRASRQARVRTS